MNEEATKISKINPLRLRQICRFEIWIMKTKRAVLISCICADHATSVYWKSIYIMPTWSDPQKPIIAMCCNTCNRCTYFKTLQTAIHPNRNSIKKISSYLTANTAFVITKTTRLIFLRKITLICQNKIHTHILWPSAHFLDITAGGPHRYHGALSWGKVLATPLRK